MSKVDGLEGDGRLGAEPFGPTQAGNDDNAEAVATVTTVAVVGLGVAVFEAALLPGVILGVAAMWAPRYFPQMGSALQPLFRSTVRGAYKMGQKTKEIVAEMQEQVEDIVAEVHAEGDVESPSKPTAINPAKTP